MAIPISSIKQIAVGADGVLRSLYPDGTVPEIPLPDAPVISLTVISSSVIRASLVSSVGADTVRLEVSDNGTTEWTELTADMGSSYDHTGITPETTKYYRPVAVNTTGETTGSVVNATTLTESTGSWTEGQEPVISSFSGTISQKSTLTLSGSNFSSVSPQVFYDDFSGGTLGANLDTNPSWIRSTGDGPYVYVDDGTFIGNRSVRVDMADGFAFHTGYSMPEPQDELYVECWFKANVIYWGSSADGDAPQVKLFRPIGGADLNPQAKHPWCGLQQFGQNGGTTLIQGGATLDLPTTYYADLDMDAGWQRYSCYLKISDLNVANGKRYVKIGGENKFTFSGLPDGGHYASPTGTVLPAEWDGEEIITHRGADGDGFMRSILLPFFCRSYQNLTIDVAGFFVNKTPERVYYGDGSTWDTCTKRIIQPTETRTDSSIGITQEVTQFPTGPIYAYVVNRDHKFNTNGFQLRAA